MNMNNFQDNLKELDVSLLDAYVGKRLKLRRVMLRMSQDELASMIGVTFQQIQKYENGSNRMSVSRLFIIAKVLQVDISFFFDGIEHDLPQFADSDPSIDIVSEGIKEFDPLFDNETLKLVNAYWKLPNTKKRQKILDFILSMI